MRTDPPFSYTVTLRDGLYLIALSGRLMGREQGEQLIAEFNGLLEQGHTRILLEMTGLEHVNSSGLNLLIGMFTKARNAGGELAICGISKKVRQLLVMTRLDSVFKIHGSIEEALKHFKV
ncbi:MAG: STAS domain-containing protein [Flavobacteriales bacterium]|nr:STAS domain-containing protein [Flavobacteriales bacterium]